MERAGLLVPSVSDADSSGRCSRARLALGFAGFFNALFKLLRTYHLGLVGQGPGFRLTETSALEASQTNVHKALNTAHGT